ncbi:MAG TPA: SIMPL domain-containing protein [Terriglobales bacterium]|nr:SIMPL domain-containing protein [Terriglobales bacterium]
MKVKSFVFVMFMFVALAAVAQSQPTSGIIPNTIYIGADGKFEAAPDTAVITFGISAQESTSRAAYDRAAQASDQIRNLLKQNGIDPKTAEIGYFSLQPVYDYRNPKRKLIAYRGNSSVTLKLKDFAKVGPILQGLADLDVTENQQISYILDNIDEAKVKATQDALQRARQQAAAVATAGGRNLGDMVYVSVDTFEPPRPVPMMRTMKMAEDAAASAPNAEFSPEKVTISAHVNVLYSLR